MKILNYLAMLLAVAPAIKASQALPGHYVTAQDYTNVQASLIEKYDDEERSNDMNQGKTYKIHVKNTGSGYLSYLMLFFSPNSKEGYRSYFTEMGFISESSLLAPNQETDVIISAYYDTDSLDDFYIGGSAYVDFTEEIHATGEMKIISHEQDGVEGLHKYAHSTQMKFDVEKDVKSDYCYGAVIKVNVGGEDNYFVVNLEDDFYFYTSVPLSDKEETDFEIVKLIKTDYPGKDARNSTRPFIDESGGNLAYALMIISGLAVIGIVGFVIFAIYRAVYRRRNNL